MMGFEPMTSSLPRKCSTTELHRRKSGRRGSNPRPIAWKAIALPTELLPLTKCHHAAFIWSEVWGSNPSWQLLPADLQSAVPPLEQTSVVTQSSLSFRLGGLFRHTNTLHRQVVIGINTYIACNTHRSFDHLHCG